MGTWKGLLPKCFEQCRIWVRLLPARGARCPGGTQLRCSLNRASGVTLQIFLCSHPRPTILRDPRHPVVIVELSLLLLVSPPIPHKVVRAKKVFSLLDLSSIENLRTSPCRIGGCGAIGSHKIGVNIGASVLGRLKQMDDHGGVQSQ